jgi:hypothetical protein
VQDPTKGIVLSHIGEIALKSILEFTGPWEK